MSAQKEGARQRTPKMAGKPTSRLHHSLKLNAQLSCQCLVPFFCKTPARQKVAIGREATSRPPIRLSVENSSIYAVKKVLCRKVCKHHLLHLGTEQLFQGTTSPAKMIVRRSLPKVAGRSGKGKVQIIETSKHHDSYSVLKQALLSGVSSWTMSTIKWGTQQHSASR